MKIFVDIDGTICTTNGNDYRNSEPIESAILRVNGMYDEGNEITYWSSRGQTSGKDWLVFTERQLKEWGCKYHFLKLTKPSFDFLFDDKAMML